MTKALRQIIAVRQWIVPLAVIAIVGACVNTLATAGGPKILKGHTIPADNFHGEVYIEPTVDGYKAIGRAAISGPFYGRAEYVSGGLHIEAMTNAGDPIHIAISSDRQFYFRLDRDKERVLRICSFLGNGQALAEAIGAGIHWKLLGQQGRTICRSTE